MTTEEAEVKLKQAASDPPEEGSLSAVEIAVRRRAGESFWVERTTGARDDGTFSRLVTEWLASLPKHVETLRDLYSGHDAFDILAGLLTLQADHHARSPAERSPFLDALAAGETAALLLLTRPGRGPSTVPVSSLPGSILRSIPNLEALSEYIGAALSGLGSSAGSDPLAVMQDRFIRRYLFVPINETEAQARAWLRDLFGGEEVGEWLATHVGFTVDEAEALITNAHQLLMAGYERVTIPPEPGIGDVLSFSLAELAGGARVSRSAADAFCRLLSQDFDQPEHTWPRLPTPMRHKPLIDDGTGRYFLVSPSLLVRGLRYTLAAHLNPAVPTGDGDEHVYQAYLARRAELVETRAVAALNELLAADFVATNLHFQITGEMKLEGEIDGLLILDGVAILVQAKSAPTRIDVVADDRARFAEVLRAILTESMRQHDDARRALAGDPEKVRFWRVEGGRRVPVEVPRVNVSTVLPITVTLEDLSGCAPALWELSDAGLATDGPLPWVVGITPLEVMLSLLRFGPQLVEFLRRRMLLNETRNLEVVDEVDIFLEFLHDHLEVVDAPVGKRGAPLVLMPPERFHALDNWLRAQREGDRRVDPPRQDLPRGLRRLLERLERDRPDAWLEISLAALGGSEERRSLIAKATNRVFDRKARNPEGISYVDSRVGNIGVVLASLRSTDPGVVSVLAEHLLTRARADGIDRLYALGVPPVRADRLISIWTGGNRGGIAEALTYRSVLEL
jgi:hypothetical protein